MKVTKNIMCLFTNHVDMARSFEQWKHEENKSLTYYVRDRYDKYIYFLFRFSGHQMLFGREIVQGKNWFLFSTHENLSPLKIIIKKICHCVESLFTCSFFTFLIMESIDRLSLTHLDIGHWIYNF